MPPTQSSPAVAAPEENKVIPCGEPTIGPATPAATSSTINSDAVCSYDIGGEKVMQRLPLSAIVNGTICGPRGLLSSIPVKNPIKSLAVPRHILHWNGLLNTEAAKGDDYQEPVYEDGDEDADEN